MIASRQAYKTRASIKTAFERLVFAGRYDAIRMADLARAANVGRSTLYTHFREKDAVLVEALQPILSALAQSVLGQKAVGAVAPALDHLWLHRRQARALLAGATGARLEASLAALVQTTLEDEQGSVLGIPSLLPRQVSASIFAVLRAWSRGEIAARAEELASYLCASSAAFADVARAWRRRP